MADDSQTGPWVLALGALTIGVAAIAAELLRRRRDGPGEERDDGLDDGSDDGRDGGRGRVRSGQNRPG